ncbi:dynein regulatory complex subunit 4-like isoform X2 [Anarrhichthys ocellatus]|uniref:dynein regulatory complex subunit 4-like isoform X2 n=1 Tax=Anarrhichthys ocellatus TaxID=433405 RepID=UPI0012EE30A9|nr:dynein regulatory complex subunit 4-like isoform X2 [Anarrhichthys ocellatus]
MTVCQQANYCFFLLPTFESVLRYLTMPPKTKSKKAVKGKSVVDGLSTEEMSKDQLEEHIVRLREELDREREERSYFQLERDKIQAFWEISKRSLEEQKAELRNRHREREEAEERHQVEITVYKQKLKHVLSEHHGTISGLKVDAVASTTLVQNQHTQSELGLQRELHGLQADFREKKLHNENIIKELKLKHQVELMELANNRDKIIRDMEVKYHEKMQSMTEAEAKKLRAEVDGIEDRMKSRVETLIEEHDRALRRADDYYSAVQKKLLLDQNKLKDELAKETKLQTRVEKKLSAAEQENKRLSEALQEAQQKLPELQKQQHDYKQAKTKIVATKARVKVLEKELRDLSMEHELLLQAFEKVQQERDELLKKQTEVILDIRQKSGLKQLLLERKLAALTETVEKKEAQLCAALSASNIDQTAGSRAANKLQGMLESKQATIEALQSDLARDCTEYDDLLQTCKEKLKDLDVPLFDFPFRPSERLLGGQTRVQDSPGPASKQ